jgi:predicted nuclease of restriction endonuclease-like (RecB) superfamily
MTNNYINKLSYVSLVVQNKVLNIGCYLLTNLKVNNFLHEIKWIGEVYPFFVM